MNISLAKALKQKNRIVTEIKRLQEVLTRENSRAVDSSSNIDCAAIYKSILDNQTDLIKIKTALAKANVGIYAQLAEMEELKGHIAYLKLLNTTNGVVKTPRYANIESSHDNFKAFITNEVRDAKIATLQARIGDLQDEVDEYNAVTRITL